MNWFIKRLHTVQNSMRKRLRALTLSAHTYRYAVKGINPRLITACDIGQDIYALKKRGVKFRHPTGIVVSQHAKIGDGTLIWQNVTIGARSMDHLEYPTIGRNVRIYAGAVIIGDITIGDNCIVGANSVVTSSFPANSIIAGIPAKKVGTVNN